MLFRSGRCGRCLCLRQAVVKAVDIAPEALPLDVAIVCFDYRPKMACQLRNSGGGHVPDDDIVDTTVIVNKTVPHMGNFLPFDLRELVAYVLGDLLGGFSDNLDASCKGSLSDLVTYKGIKRCLGHLARQEFGLQKNVAKKLKN